MKVRHIEGKWLETLSERVRDTAQKEREKESRLRECEKEGKMKEKDRKKEK